MQRVKCPNPDCGYIADSRDQLTLFPDIVHDITECDTCGLHSRIVDWTDVETDKPQPCEAMIDIETLDTKNSAVVFQVAIVFFNPETHGIICRETWDLDVEQQLGLGRTVSASTIAFHLGIPDNAMRALNNKNAVGVMDFYAEFEDNIEQMKPDYVWSKGNFDFNVLKDLFGHWTTPWQFYQERELRTLMKECKVPKGDVAHTALDDCLAQINQLAACRHVIRLGLANGAT